MALARADDSNTFVLGMGPRNRGHLDVERSPFHPPRPERAQPPNCDRPLPLRVRPRLLPATSRRRPTRLLCDRAVRRVRRHSAAISRRDQRQNAFHAPHAARRCLSSRSGGGRPRTLVRRGGSACIGGALGCVSSRLARSPFCSRTWRGRRGCCTSLGYVGEDVHRAARINDLEWGEVSLVAKQRIE